MNSTVGDLVTWILHVQDHFVPFLRVLGRPPGGITYLSPGEQSEQFSTLLYSGVRKRTSPGSYFLTLALQTFLLPTGYII